MLTPIEVIHDAVEDCDESKKLKLIFNLERTFEPYIVDAIRAMTHAYSESYDDYVERVAQNYLARKVKVADLTHNMDPRRIPARQIVDKDFARWDKYRKALIRLERDA